MAPWPREASFCPPAMVHLTLAGAPEAIRAVNWSVCVVSRAAFSALMTRLPGLAPTAPQPAASRSNNGAARGSRPSADFAIAAPYIARILRSLDRRHESRKAYGQTKDMPVEVGSS